MSRGPASPAARIVAWQRRHGRHDLPWQQTRDAYRIWLSEIMLQQTQVATVVPYFLRFVARFPDVHALAAAPLEEVLALWSGLGYYARARNLHRCARAVVAAHGGSFPASPEQLAGLPGIGRSTAAAIAVFAFGVRAPILDGNVKRVLCRYHAIEGDPASGAVGRALWDLAAALLPTRGIEAYTQGLMDLGATVCTRAAPACPVCPLAGDCRAHADGRENALPTARSRPERPLRTWDVLVLDDGGGFLLEARPPSGIWGGLLAPPVLAAGETAAVGARRLGLDARSSHALPEFRHAFTHFHLNLRPVLVRVGAGPCAATAGLRRVPYRELSAAPLPAPVARLLARVAAGISSPAPAA